MIRRERERLPRPSAPLLPGATIGVLGSGQLGRMLALAARPMGYAVHVFSPGRGTPAGMVADCETTAAYSDLEAVRAFAQAVDVVTYEFENVALAAAEAAAEIVPVWPQPHVLAIAQNRLREKGFLREAGLPTTAFAPVRTAAELEAAIASVGLPAVLKTAESGYDGKGQARIEQGEAAAEAWRRLGEHDCVLESFVDFVGEFSVVVARAVTGEITHWGVIENFHRDHILDLSVAPARLEDKTADAALALAQAVVEALEAVGVICVELFLTADGRWLINEIAPRPHNSGHLTIEGFETSQFEQQARAVCGLPLGRTAQQRPAALANLLGDLWPAGGEPNWAAALADPAVKLHLYGKREARPGRKMGHLTATGETAEGALAAVLAARERLNPQARWKKRVETR